jgi:acetate---CoA ligase (ADP-forming)
MNLDNFFNPKSVAVIGASSDKSKVGYAVMVNLCVGRENGEGPTFAREIYPVSISESEILGLKTYKSISDVTKVRPSLDLAIIIVRADIVPQILNECGERGIKSVIIISAGFKEIGEAGKILEDKVKEIANKFGITLLGPNCLGTIDSQTDFNASFGAKKPIKGSIAFLSQSGALGTSILDMAVKEGIGFSKFISLGNEAQLTEMEFLEYLADDLDTKAILIYLEKLSDGKKFMELASEITKKKPIVVLKAGRSARGLEAVMSHTGSLAPEDSVFGAALKQSNVIAVNSMREFFNMAKLFQLGIMKPLSNLVILTNGGGPSVVATDLVDLSKSLSLVELSDSTKEALRKVLPSMAAVGNPIDIIGDALSLRYEEVLKILSIENGIDGIILMLTPQMMTEVEATAKLIVQYRNKKPIIPVFLGGPTIEKGLEYLIENKIVNFNFPVDAVEALDDLAFGEIKTKILFKQQKINNGAGSKMMDFDKMTGLLKDYDIPLAGILLKEKGKLITAISKLGNGPYAMKVISNNIVHKTDAGAVQLNIKSLEEANIAWNSMEKKVLKENPNAQIEGFLIQRMGVGREVIIGMKRDATFGPTILFGLGGILAEAIKDTSLRIAPIGKNEALQMMQEIKGASILNGMRGERPIDFDVLADIIVNISRLSIEHSEIKEIDLNPVMVTNMAAVIVDARGME